MLFPSRLQCAAVVAAHRHYGRSPQRPNVSSPSTRSPASTHRASSSSRPRRRPPTTPRQGKFASNILHHVSAAELKAEHMVKLPIKLDTRADWKEVLAEAVTRNGLLETNRHRRGKADRRIHPADCAVTGAAEESDQGNADGRSCSAIADRRFSYSRRPDCRATGQTREIDDVDLFERDCEFGSSSL